MKSINELSIEQKVGQLMMIGWQSPFAGDIVELIKTYHFGNIILFTRNIKNPEQLKALTTEIQKAAIEYNGIPALIATDQEGGSVRRIYDGVTRVPGHMAIGAASYSNSKAAAQIGAIIGEELKELGINHILAPVADVNTNPQNPIIATRSFGDNPHMVKQLSHDFAKGLQDQNALACYKHFIGHGNVNIDSHLDLPYLDTSLEELEKVELLPYMGDWLPDSIMSSHILYRSLDDRFPASISKKIIKNYLREKLHYQGVVISDDFEMNAILRAFSLKEASVFAIQAGTDIVTVSHTFGRQMIVRKALIEAIQEKTISQTELTDSLNRIIRIKEKYAQPTISKPVDYARNEIISKKVSLESVTVKGEIFDIDKSTLVIGVTNYVNSIAEDVNIEKMDVAKFLGENLGLDYLSIDNKNINTHDISKWVKNKKVILNLTDSHLTLVQRVLYTNVLESASEIILVSLRTPYDVLGQNKPKCHIALYEYTELSLESLLKVLKKKRGVGEFPVQLETGRSERPRSGRLIDGITSHIDHNYSSHLSLETIGEEFLLSRGYVSYLFKDKLQTTFSKYLNATRIRHAKKLLKETHYRVYEVGNICGYRDNQYFTKIFKKYVGVTPSHFRNENSRFD